MNDKLLENKPRGTEKASESLADLSVGRGTDTSTLLGGRGFDPDAEFDRAMKAGAKPHIAPGEAARSVTFPVVLSGAEFPTRMELASTAPGEHVAGDKVLNVSRPSALQGQGWATSQSHPIEPHKFEKDLHDPAADRRALVLTRDASTGSYGYTFVSFKGNLDLGPANPNN